MIPQGFIQELLSRLDIVEVISRHVPLKKTGKNYIACCPFHKEKTPSFTVTPSKQIYKCFGCGAFGDAIRFTMNYEGLSYPEAIKALAGRLGMEVPEDPEGKRRATKAKTLYDHTEAAKDFYRSQLAKSEVGKNYLKKRGIGSEIAAIYSLGYSPDAWNALKEVFGDAYEGKELQDAEGCGLVIRNDAGRCYDRFRGRLMFPIRNPRGQVIGFGARTLDGDEHPKYLNSPETPIYHKGKEIYGLFEANDTIRAKHRAVICEGYMDVIQLAQAGFREAVAALGTSVTSEHVRKLLKVTDTLYFSFDGDSAGQHALRRGLEAALPAINDGQSVRFIVLPPEHDPDSLIKEKGAAAFEEAMKNSLSLSEFFVKSVGEGKDLATPEGRGAFLNDAKPLIVSMRSAPFMRAQLVSFLAMKARMSPDDLEVAFGIAKPRTIVKQTEPEPGLPRWNRRFAPVRRPVNPVVAIQGVADYSERILSDFLNFPELCGEFAGSVEEYFIGREDRLAREILEVWRTALSEDPPIQKTHLLLELLSESESIENYRDAVAKEIPLDSTLEKARNEVKSAFLRMEASRLREQASEVAAVEPLDAELYTRLTAREKEVKAEIQKLERAVEVTI